MNVEEGISGLIEIFAGDKEEDLELAKSLAASLRRIFDARLGVENRGISFVNKFFSQTFH